MRTIHAAAAIGAIALTAVAHAQEGSQPLGFYVGAEFGSAKSTSGVPTWVGDVAIDQSATGWSAFAGIRPYRFLGAELSYTDFGTTHRDNLDVGSGDIVYRAQAKTSAYGGYAMGYLPVLPNRWDLFAKVGYAGLTSKTDSLGNYTNVYIANSPTPIGTASLSFKHQGSGFAYGFGTQYRFGALGVRAEYQRVSVSGSSPSLLSLGAYWNF